MQMKIERKYVNLQFLMLQLLVGKVLFYILAFYRSIIIRGQ